MEVQVIYSSKTGKTKKIAQAIAEELSTTAQEVGTAMPKKEAALFLGSGCYGRKPGKDMIAFIEHHDFSSVPVALFGTSAGGEGKEVSFMENLLRAKGADVLDTFYCKGSFLYVFGRGHPNTSDIAAAKTFATNIKASLS